MSKMVVAHFVDRYLFITGSWIYNTLTGQKRFKPIVLTNSTQNLDIFPFKPIYSYFDLSIFKKAIIRLRNTGHFGDVYYNHFYEAIKRNKAILLHSHFGDASFSILKLKEKLDIPKVTTFYGYDVSLPKRDPIWKERYERLFTMEDLFIVEGNFMKKCLIELGCPEDKVVVNHIGVDLRKLPFRPRRLNPGEKVKVLIAASFKEKKGIPYAIQAFAKVLANYPNMELRIIGDGPMRNEIIELIANLGIENHVKLLGYQPYQIYRSELLKCHLFMLPSVTAMNGDTEGGSPVAITEAQATGMPVLSTYHADIPEVVIDGETGLLSQERDIDGLAKNLEYLVSHPELWETMGKRAREHVERKFNLRKQISRLEEIYSQLLVR